MALFSDSNDWRAAMQDVSAAIDDAFGECVEVVPVRSGGVNFSPIPEPQKAVVVMACFMAKADIALGDSVGKIRSGHTLAPLISTRRPVFTFDHHALPWPIMQGYRIRLIRTGEWFEAKDVQSDSVARLTVSVVELGREKAEPIREQVNEWQHPPMTPGTR